MVPKLLVALTEVLVPALVCFGLYLFWHNYFTFLATSLYFY
jgi:hypothetical protein